MLTLTVLARDIGARYLHRKNSILPPVAVPSSDVQKQSKEFDRTILRKGISQRDEDNNQIVLRGKDGGDGEMILIYKIHEVKNIVRILFHLERPHINIVFDHLLSSADIYIYLDLFYNRQ